ncbi:hypothetical protein TWF718_005338 [Orbilia javanica]|uniref:Nucleoside phosphorylase domain-containing protein n=1 Tax=Orbilia javanica TaxID=47235 RepID=A0AAN8MYS3_9PEZI
MTISREDFQVAIICALPLEYDAVCLLFDEEWEQDESNHKYKMGSMGGHKVVLILLSSMGKVSAASATAVIKGDYPNLKLAFLVGICGGVPRPGDLDHEILLGDVVISDGILQYDFGKQHPGSFSINNRGGKHLKSPETFILDQLAPLRSVDGRDKIQKLTTKHLKDLQDKAAQKKRGGKYNYLGAANDRLFEPIYRHKHRVLQDSGIQCTTCDDGLELVCQAALDSPCELLNCIDEKQLVPRKRLERILEGENAHDHELAIHVGLVGSGDMVIKSGEHRDGWAKSEGIIAFEMEGAGVSGTIQCIVVKGVSDYADSHKNKEWQNFAAATAASALKALLQSYPLYRRTTDVILSPQSASELATSETQDQIYSQEKLRIAQDVQKRLPDLVQTMSEDLGRQLQWTPFLSAAPAAICVMATCLVAGSSDATSDVIINVRPVKVNGVLTEPSKYLGTNLEDCNNLGKKAFSQAEQGMRKLQDRAQFVTGKTGPLAEIVLGLSDSKPDFSSLEGWMEDLAAAASICLTEATLIKTKFDELLSVIEELKRATVDARNQNSRLLKAEVEEKTVKDEYACRLQQAEIEKATREAELDEARNKLQDAYENTTKVLKENPCEKIQAKINKIDSKIHKIGQQESSWFAFGRFFRGKTGGKDQDERKKKLVDKRKDLANQREKYLTHDQTSAIKESETCQKRVAEAERRFRESQDKCMALVKEQFQSGKCFNNACDDLKKLSDTNLDLETINQILFRSVRALKELNKYITQMTKFFTNVSSYVDDTMRLRLQQFKKTTKDVEKGEKSRTQADNEAHKTSAIMTALDLGGRFTLIYKIARVYIDVSENYIEPGIKEMEELTWLEDDEYPGKLASFEEWGKKAVADIEALAAKTNPHIKDAVFQNIGSLAQKQIGADIGASEGLRRLSLAHV